jgi:CubicO group peptidase (beta-lactamase class C family)
MRRASSKATAAAAALVLATMPGCDGSPSDPASSRDTLGTSAAASTSANELPRLGAVIAQRVETYMDRNENAFYRPVRAVIINVDGHTVLEHYNQAASDDTRNVFSVTKSFVSTLIGIALSDGSLRSVDQTLGELLPRYAADMGPEEAAITLRQLLTMTAGLPDTSGATEY